MWHLETNQLARTLSKGIYNDVGEKGAMISGGQRQRIAIARALDFSPELLILNEVTKVLDPDSEQDTAFKILNLMGKITVLAITQRAAFLEIADRIYHLDAGRIDAQTDNRQKSTKPQTSGLKASIALVGLPTCKEALATGYGEGVCARRSDLNIRSASKP